ncbi:MAG: BCCT family transporter [Enterobacteriaceae bacterium]
MNISNNIASNKVFYISILVVVCIVSMGVFWPEQFTRVGTGLFVYLTRHFGWLYILVMFSFVLFTLYLLFSPYGNVVLGPDGEKPAYSLPVWFAMLFSAGKGIGLLFYGTAEPLSHFISPLGAESGSPEAMSFAISKSFYHWGLHPWSGYCVMALGLAYFQFRKGKSGLISTLFIPLIGEKRAKGAIGQCIDILAIFATVGGVATSFGLGTYQINSGLNFLFGVPQDNQARMWIIVAVTALLLTSISAGLNKGMKTLSLINLILSIVIMALVFLLGPKLLIVNSFVEGLGNYLGGFVSSSLQLGAFSAKESSWYSNWTVYYWAWWIAWAPFVGTFIARISRGRTIRQFVIGVLLAPTLASCLWFAIFGTTAINVGVEVGLEAIKDTSTAIYLVMQQYPLSQLLMLLTIILLFAFFLASADAATYVLGMFSSHGALNPATSRKILWGVIQAALALILIVASGSDGLRMLQTISIAAAFPFIFVMILSMISLLKVLRTETKQPPAEQFEMEQTSGSDIRSEI